MPEVMNRRAGSPGISRPGRTTDFLMLPKAELHCHIEGAAAPDLVIGQALKYNEDVSAIIKDGVFVWHDFTSFLHAFDVSANLFRTEDDYALLAEHYLTSLAADGAIYSEFFTSPDHARQAGLSPEAYTDGLAEGMRQAKTKTGIESRMIVTGVRHCGVESIEAAARFAVEHDEPLITGFGVAGEERMGHMSEYVKAFDIARDAGLGITIHAGELVGPQSVYDALEYIRPSRIGHGVRSIEDADLVKRLADERIVLEVCPGSNISLSVFPSFADHPFPKLRDAGCIVTLSSDDPPYFHTSLAHEYDIAREHFGLDDEDLLGVTRASIEAAFVDEDTRKALLARI